MNAPLLPVRRFRTSAALVLALGIVIGTAGCGARRKGITEHQRKEAAHLVAEADFALNLRQWPRAEGLLAKAAGLVPDEGEVWTTLGAVRVRQGKRSGAKEAYERALKAYEEEAAAAKTVAEPWLRQVSVLALLGRAGEGRALLEKIAKRFPQDRGLRAFIDNKQLDRMLEDPEFKQVAL